MPDDLQSAVWRRVTAPNTHGGGFLTPLWLDAQSAAAEYEQLARIGGKAGAILARAAQAQRENALCLRGMLRAQLRPLPRVPAPVKRTPDEALHARAAQCRDFYRHYIALSPDAEFGPVFALMAERQKLIWQLLLIALAST